MFLTCCDRFVNTSTIFFTEKSITCEENYFVTKWLRQQLDSCIQKRINSLNFKPFLNTVYLLSRTGKMSNSHLEKVFSWQIYSIIATRYYCLPYFKWPFTALLDNLAIFSEVVFVRISQDCCRNFYFFIHSNHGLQALNEGINQRNLKRLGQM